MKSAHILFTFHPVNFWPDICAAKKPFSTVLSPSRWRLKIVRYCGKSTSSALTLQTSLRLVDAETSLQLQTDDLENGQTSLRRLLWSQSCCQHRILNLCLIMCLRTLSIRWTTRDPGGWWRVATWASAVEAYRCRSHRWRSSLQIINKRQINMFIFPVDLGHLKPRLDQVKW